MLKLLICALLASMAWGNVLQEFSRSNAKFSAAVYREMLKKSSGNFLVCPISVEIAMAMIGAGAKDNTALEIFRGLGLPEDPTQVEELFKQLTPKLKGNEYYALNTANQIFLKRDYSIKPGFKDVLMSVYNAGIQLIDFVKKVEAAATINEWVESKTNKKIKDLISPDSLNADTILVLVNAIYFKGKWVHPFEEYLTKKMPFYTLDGGSKQVDTMSGTSNFRYYENVELDAKFLEMPFEGDDIAMVIVLPNKKNGLPALEQQLDKVFVEQPYTNERVVVQIPKFVIETEIQFQDILKNLGVKDAFTPGKANFSGISDDSLYIDLVIQKTYMNLTESGVEAAAATAVALQPIAAIIPAPVTKRFIADHPFLYCLILKNLKVVLFAGRYNLPQK